MTQQAYQLQSTKLALEEMRRSMDKKWLASDALNANGFQLLGAAGVALVLAVTVNAPPADTALRWVYWALLSAAFLVYLVMLGTVLSATQPESYATGIKADWDVLRDGLMLNDERQASLTLVSTLVEALPQNEQVNQAKARHVRRAMKLLVVIVFFLLLARAVAAV